ncbi:MAG: type II toxin-antitoxin system RelE/ParE family toxin [Candidatus Woesearchaeota archaeon]
MYELVFTSKSEKQLEKLSPIIQDRIIRSLERIRIRPEAYIHRLVGVPDYKFRVGDYRIILNIDKGKLIILVISLGHRKHIYDV